MTDPRIAAAVADMTASAARMRASRTLSVDFTFGPTTVSLVAPAECASADISVASGFLPGGALSDNSFRINLLYDSIAGEPPAFAWPGEWSLPFGVLQPRHAAPFRFAIDIHSGSFSAFDPSAREATTWFPALGAIPYWAAATPFRLPLSWIADTFDGEMIHAAGVKVGDRAALIVGPSGAGKSSLALACLRQGHHLLGDDFLLLNDGHASAVYRRMKMHDATRALLGGDVSDIGRVINADSLGEKRILDTDRRHLWQGPLEVSAVFIPRIADRARWARLPAAEAVRRALGPTMQGLLGGTAGSLRRIAQLMRTTPAFEISVGPDLGANARLLADLTQECAWL